MEITFRIQNKIKEFEERLQLLEFKMSEEMQKPYQIRENRLLEFIYKEKSVYDFAILELKDLIEVKEI
jgi:hypothetical protein